MKRLLLVMFLPLLMLKAQAQCLPCGTGADGPFNPTQDTVLAGGTYNFSSFTINAGITVTDTGVLPVVIHCTGAVTINGTLTASGGNGTDGITFSQAGTGGIAVAGGANGADGNYSVSQGQIPGTNGLGSGGGNGGLGWSGGGGAGYSAVGVDAGPGVGLGGPTYGTPQIVILVGGSGGGGGSGGYNCGSGGGGAGGGIIQIGACGTITIGAAGFIKANGGNGGSDGNGNCGGGGAGSGGTVWLSAPSIVNNGSVLANGGTGGASTEVGAPYYGVGGNGADGRIRFDYTALSGSGTVSPASGYSGHINVSQSDTNVLCHGGNTGGAVVTPSGGSSPYTYLWSTGGIDSTIIGLVAGTYTVTITDATGCETTDTAIITEPAVIALTMSHTNANLGNNGTATVAASGGTPGYTYHWMPGNGTTATITGLTAGLYTVTVTDANGCTSTDTVRVRNTLGVAQQNLLANVSLYPNPASETVNLQMDIKRSGNITIQLLDYTGRLLTAKSYKTTLGNVNYTIPVAAYPSGTYIVRVVADDEVKNLPLTIMR